MRKLNYLKYVPYYIWYHKAIFGIRRTKFDISYRVFRESFVNDHYYIRKFLDHIQKAHSIFFLDLGRNHGFVFYYMMYYIMKTRFPVSVINYYGIDPSPLKFVYFNFPKFLSNKSIEINYFLLDRGIVFDGSSWAKLKYGENNFGNFNVSGSNYAAKRSASKKRYSYVELNVETISLSSIEDIIEEHLAADAVILKIDCKNQTDIIFFEFADMIKHRKKPYLIASERDGSSGRDVSPYVRKYPNTLCDTNVFT